VGYFKKTGKKIMAWCKNTLGWGAATFCTESGKPEKSIKLDRKRYEKCK
jgi:hypothetical protein